MLRALILERVMLAALAAAALGLLPEAYRVGLWMRSDPGPGLYPAAVLVAIVIVSAILAVTAKPTISGRSAVAVQGILLPTVAAALIMVPLIMSQAGFRLTGFVFTFALMGAMSPRRTPLRLLVLAVAACAATLGFNELFAEVFRIYLPRGRLTGF